MISEGYTFHRLDDINYQAAVTTIAPESGETDTTTTSTDTTNTASTTNPANTTNPTSTTNPTADTANATKQQYTIGNRQTCTGTKYPKHNPCPCTIGYSNYNSINSLRLETITERKTYEKIYISCLGDVMHYAFHICIRSRFAL